MTSPSKGQTSDEELDGHSTGTFCLPGALYLEWYSQTAILPVTPYTFICRPN